MPKHMVQMAVHQMSQMHLQVIVAESYGGQDEPVDTIVSSLVDVNAAPLFDPLRVREVPTEATYQVQSPIDALALCTSMVRQ